MSIDLFLHDLNKLIDGLDKAAEVALSETAALGLDSLKNTSRFQNRTGDLRAAFQVSGNGFSRMIEVNPSASSSIGQTPPSTYAVFLENGTKFMEPRPFFGDARERLEQQYQQVFERAFESILK